MASLPSSFVAHPLRAKTVQKLIALHVSAVQKPQGIGFLAIAPGVHAACPVSSGWLCTEQSKTSSSVY